MSMYTINYLGELRTELTHTGSGSVIVTDAPVDNNGKGSAFSPTDMVAAALASCMITIMGIRAAKEGMVLGNISATIDKEMKNDPRRVGAVKIVMSVQNMQYSEDQKKILWDAAINCPVAKSLDPDIDQELEMNFVD